MLPELQETYDRLEGARRDLIAVIRSLGPGILSPKPGQERWSILQDFQHLVLAEQKTILEFGSIPASEVSNPNHLAMVLNVLDGDIRVEVPAPEMVPDGEADLDDLVQDWGRARDRLRRFLESCGTNDLERPVTRHPVTGPLTVIESLRVLASHFHHHRRRIEAAIEGHK